MIPYASGLQSPTHQQLYSLLTQQPAGGLQQISAAEDAFNSNTSTAMQQLLLQSNLNGSKLVVANALWTNHTPMLPEYTENMMTLFQVRSQWHLSAPRQCQRMTSLTKHKFSISMRLMLPV